MSQQSRSGDFSNARRLLQNAMSEIDLVERRYSGRSRSLSAGYSPTGSSSARGSSDSAGMSFDSAGSLRSSDSTGSTLADATRRADNDGRSVFRSVALATEQRQLFGRNSSGNRRSLSLRARGNSGGLSRRSHPYGFADHRKRRVFTINTVCLSDHQQSFPPSIQDRARLNAAGFGEQRVVLGQDDDPLEVDSTLLQHFPDLEDTGYELMRISPRRHLEVLTVPNGLLTAANIKIALGQAKLYLRPIKRSLALQSVQSKCAEQPSLQCDLCGGTFPQASLRAHLASCTPGTDAMTTTADPSVSLLDDLQETRSEFTQSPTVLQHTSPSPIQPTVNASHSLDRDNGSSSKGTTSLYSSALSQLLQIFPDHPISLLQAALSSCSMDIDLAVSAVLDNIVKPMTEEESGFQSAAKSSTTVIDLNDQDVNSTQSSNNEGTDMAESKVADNPSQSVADLLASVGPEPNSGMPPMRLTVSRTEILSDAFAFFKSGKYNPKQEFRIQFEGEPAVDGGGPRREFFSLLLQQLLSSSASVRLFEGPKEKYLPMHNIDGLMGGLFRVAGQIISASALQGGPKFSCLSQPVYTYMVTSSLDRVLDVVKISDLPDPCLAEALEKICAMEDDTTREFCEVSGMLVDNLIAAGFTHRLTVSNKADAVTSILLHEIIISRKSEIDQLAIGLGPILDLCRRFPDIMRPLLTAQSPTELTAEEFVEMLDFESTIPVHIKGYFLRYINDAGSSKLAKLLQFCSGSAEKPAMGFSDKLIVSTVRSSFPNVSTCALILELPKQCATYDEFAGNMDSVIEMQATGFGIV